MKEVKTKLGQITPYEHEASQFKNELRDELMIRFSQKSSKRVNNFGHLFNKRLISGFATFMLVVFVGYQFFIQPLTAYAYLKDVQTIHKNMVNQGVSIVSNHFIEGEMYTIQFSKDVNSNFSIIVTNNDKIIEDFVIEDGVLYVDQNLNKTDEIIDKTVELEEGAIENEYDSIENEEEIMISSQEKQLTMIINSLILAQITDPYLEWNEILEMDNVQIDEISNNEVMISYVENIDGVLFVKKLYFKDYMPVKTVKVRVDTAVKSDNFELKAVAEDSVESDSVNESVALRAVPVINDNKIIEEIIYNKFTVLDTKIVHGNKEIFVDNHVFNTKMATLISNDLNNLTSEYNTFSDKSDYLPIANNGLLEEESIIVNNEIITKPTLKDVYLTQFFEALVIDPSTTLIAENEEKDLNEDDLDDEKVEEVKIVESDATITDIAATTKVVPTNSGSVEAIAIDTTEEVPSIIDTSVPADYMAETADPDLEEIKRNLKERLEAMEEKKVSEDLEKNALSFKDLAERRAEIEAQKQAVRDEEEEKQRLLDQEAREARELLLPDRTVEIKNEFEK